MTSLKIKRVKVELLYSESKSIDNHLPGPRKNSKTKNYPLRPSSLRNNMANNIPSNEPEATSPG